MNTPPDNILDFANTDQEAQARYDAHCYDDPSPLNSISPALLNRDDIRKYVAHTGMIYPFHPGNLHKQASYSVALKGRCIYWDDAGVKQDFILSKEIMEDYPAEKHEYQDSFKLSRNSIAFVTLEPKFRLPFYMAARFNLKIKNVYRGLLLGTGPLVDPGFQSRISFPLHNLTDQPYVYEAGEEIVWFEFTKLSQIDAAKVREEQSKKDNENSPFPKRKLEREDIHDYLMHANPHSPVRSSIPVDIKRVDTVEKIAKRFSWTSAISLLVAMIAFLALMVQLHSFINATGRSVSVEREKNNAVMLQKIDSLSDRIEALESQPTAPNSNNEETKDEN